MLRAKLNPIVLGYKLDHVVYGDMPSCLQSDALILFKEDDDGYIVIKMHFGDVSCFSKFCVQGCEVYLAGYEAIELL